MPRKSGVSQFDLPPGSDNAPFTAPGARWTSIPKLSKSDSTLRSRSGSKPRSGVFQSPGSEIEGTSNAESHRPTKHASFFRIHQPSKVEKRKMADAGSYPAPKKRRLRLDGPSSSLPEGTNVDTLLDKIIQKARFGFQAQPWGCQSSGVENGKLHDDEPSHSPKKHLLPGDKPVSNFQQRGDVETSLDNIIRNSRFASQFRPSGYRPPTVEDDTDGGSDGQGKARTFSSFVPVLKRTSDVSMADGSDPKARTSDISMADGSDPKSRTSDTSMIDVDEISPGTRPDKTVHWASHIRGPSGTGHPGTQVPTKSVLTQHVSIFDKDAGQESAPRTPVRGSGKQTHKEALEAEIPSPFLPISNPPSAQLLPRKSFSLAATSSHPTKLPTPPNTPRRSPRFQNTQSSHPDLQATSGSKSNPATQIRPPLETTSNVALNSPPYDTLEKAELNYLRSEIFDPKMIRPVPDLSQVFESLIGTFGQPGTGFLQAGFAPPSPGNSKSATSKHKSRKYSINPNLKSRHLDIELLRIRVSHAMLLSFNLDPNARRDAIEIGDLAEFAVGPSTNLPGRSLFRGIDLEFRNTSGIGKLKQEKVDVGTGILNGRSGNRRRNSDKEAWIEMEDGSRKRRRESEGDLESRKERKINLEKKMARAADEGDSKALAEVSREITGSSPRLAGLGTMNVMFWRLVRVSGLVEVDVKTRGKIGVEKTEEVHSAWWAVPEKAIVGMF